MGTECPVGIPPVSGGRTVIMSVTRQEPGPPPAPTAPSTTTKPGTVGARGLGPRANASPASCPKGNEHGYPVLPHPRTTSTNRHQPGQNRAQQRNPAPWGPGGSAPGQTQARRAAQKATSTVTQFFRTPELRRPTATSPDSTDSTDSTTTKPGTVGAQRLGPRGKRKPGELPKRQRAWLAI